MRILAIGRSRKSPETALFDRYAARIRPALELREFDDGQGSPAEIKRREAILLLGGIVAGDFVVALDSGGTAPDSVEFSGLLRRWSETGKKLSFVIGGAEGLDAAVIARADAVISLGRLTWPHMLARVMLAEQIYRAQMIVTGHPYHRAGRP
jgi:23S rRNA (pseudouridine1915-N3)-methyltransferase